MARKSPTPRTPAKISKKNKPGDIGITSNGKFKVWTGQGWSGNYESQTGAIDFMKTLQGDIGPRIIEARKRGGTISRKKGGNIMKGRKGGGTVKKQVGGLTQGYDARLDESLAARHPATRGNLAARRAESEGMERALRRGPYSGARTMVKKGGSVRRKKGSTVSRKRGSKIMQGYKAGGKV